MRKISKKRAKDNKSYHKLRKIFLEENSFCQIKSPICRNVSEVIHHSRGRIGHLYLDTKWWIASCWACNNFLENHKQWGYENGFRLDRIGIYE